MPIVYAAPFSNYRILMHVPLALRQGYGDGNTDLHDVEGTHNNFKPTTDRVGKGFIGRNCRKLVGN